MKLLLTAVLFGLGFSSTSFANGLYSDTWVNWSPSGKVYDVVCFSKKDGNKVYKDIRILQFNRRAFQYKESTPGSEPASLSSKNCFFEQKDPHPVSRDEFFEEIVSVKCSLNQLPFKDGDFRILGTNSVTTSVKRLRDGKVWILPTNDCTFTTQLERKPMVPAPQQQSPIQVNSELTFPGQIDQMSSGQMTAQPSPIAKEPPSVKKKEDQKVSLQPPVETKPKPSVEDPLEEPVASPPPKSPISRGTIKNLINTLN